MNCFKINKQATTNTQFCQPLFLNWVHFTLLEHFEHIILIQKDLFSILPTYLWLHTSDPSINWVDPQIVSQISGFLFICLYVVQLKESTFPSLPLLKIHFCHKFSLFQWIFSNFVPLSSKICLWWLSNIIGLSRNL